MTEIRQKVFKNTFFISLYQVASKVLSFVFLIYAARYLGSAVFGKYNYASTFVTFFLLLSVFGLTTLQIREIARDKKKAPLYVSNILLMRMSFTLLAFTVLWLLTLFLPYDSETITALRIFGLAMFFQITSFTFIDTFIALDRASLYSLTLVFNHILLSVIGIILLVRGYGLVALAWLWFFSWLVTAVLSVIISHRYVFSFRLKLDLKFCCQLIKEAWPFLLSTLTFLLFFKVDTVLLFSLKGAQQTGWYSAAYRVIEALLFVPQSLMLAVFPSLSKLYLEKEKSMIDVAKKSFRYLNLFSFPLAFGGLALSVSLVSFVFGSAFAKAAIIFPILVFSFPFVSLREGSIQILNARNQQKINFYIDVSGLVFNVGLNLALIPLYGFIGAAWATLLSYLLVVLLSLVYLRLPFDFTELIGSFGKPLLASALMWLVLRWLNSFHLPVLMAILVGMLVYFLLLWLIRGFSGDELSFLWLRLRKGAS